MYKITDTKLIELEDEILIGYKGYNTTYFYCPKCKKEVDLLRHWVDEDGNYHLNCPDCDTPIEWKESE